MSHVFFSTSINLIYGLLLPFTPFLSVGSCHLRLFSGESHSSQTVLDYASSVCARLTGFPLETMGPPSSVRRRSDVRPWPWLWVCGLESG